MLSTQNQSIRWNTAALPCPADEVILFANREDAQRAADNRRGFALHNCQRRSVRIIPRAVKVASLRLEVFAVVVGAK